MKYVTSLAIITLFFSHATLATTTHEKLLKCAKNRDSLERLVCYDKLAESIENGPDIKPQPQTRNTISSKAVKPVVMSKNEDNHPNEELSVKTEERDEASAKFGQEHKQPEKELVKKIHADVVKLNKNAYGKHLITLNNGQIWRQTDSKQFKLSEGETVYIERGFLGSFFIGKESINKRIRAKRVK